MLFNATKGQVIRYALMPQVAPRVKEFLSSGFRNLAYFMALVYRAVNLLPATHAFLKPNSIGTFSIRDVLAAAAENLTFSVKHIDQIIIFSALIAGIVILGLQFFLLLISFFINSASAAEMPANYAKFFTTKNPSEDIALRLLDSVFGVEGMFNSKDIEGGSTAFHTALHQLFQFYSTGLLVIAVMIVVYFIFAVLAETAQTGTPFGKRFNHVWAPIRLVAAIGLLIPIGAGLNSGQWIALYAAKFGSGFATNGWIKFNETIEENYIPADRLVAKPDLPSLRDISAFMMIAHACKDAFMHEYNNHHGTGLGEQIDAWVLSPDSEKPPLRLSATGYLDAVKLSNYDTIKIRIGHYDTNTYTEDTSAVAPYCGEATLTIPENPTKTTSSGDVSLNGTGFLNARYYIMMKEMWTGGRASYIQMKKFAENMMSNRLNHNKLDEPKASLKDDIEQEAKKFIYEGLKQTAEDIKGDFSQGDDLLKYGWGGAGIWYNKIAEVNGKFTTASMNKPLPRLYPKPMEKACEKNKQQNAKTDPKECYALRLSKNKDSQFVDPRQKNIAAALNNVFDFWYKNDGEKTSNTIIDVMNMILGTQGLFDMCKNANIHPLAQLSAVGKGLVEAAIRNLGIAGFAGVGGALPFIGPALSSASGFAMTLASIGILIGFMLYYIVPFMPFLYFLFAVGGWVKGLFEAMVGIPLWALAHIRIDGQGLPGDAAINGYFLIFEIFIRPILIVFGLLASILIFGAMVKVLNEIFSLVVSNLSGFDAANAGTTCGGGSTTDTGYAPTGSADYFRGPVDEFFFTIVYAILVYMIGMSSFKLIDLIPNNILRWMGAGVETFNDKAGEPAEGLMTKMAVGGSLMGGQLQSAASGAGGALKNFGKAGVGAVTGGGKKNG